MITHNFQEAYDLYFQLSEKTGGMLKELSEYPDKTDPLFAHLQERYFYYVNKQNFIADEMNYYAYQNQIRRVK